MAGKIIAKLEQWPTLPGEEMVPTLTRAVNHMLKSIDARRALTMSYDDGPLSVVVKPTVDIMVAYCEKHIERLGDSSRR
jgi:hypothetical protein